MSTEPSYRVQSIKLDRNFPQRLEIVFYYHPNMDNISNIVFNGIDHIEVTNIEKKSDDKIIIIELSKPPTPPYSLMLYTQKQYKVKYPTEQTVTREVAQT